jgi:hypothetical protein
MVHGLNHQVVDLGGRACLPAKRNLAGLAECIVHSFKQGGCANMSDPQLHVGTVTLVPQVPEGVQVHLLQKRTNETQGWLGPGETQSQPTFPRFEAEAPRI